MSQPQEPLLLTEKQFTHRYFYIDRKLSSVGSNQTFGNSSEESIEIQLSKIHGEHSNLLIEEGLSELKIFLSRLFPSDGKTYHQLLKEKQLELLNPIVMKLLKIFMNTEQFYNKTIISQILIQYGQYVAQVASKEEVLETLIRGLNSIDQFSRIRSVEAVAHLLRHFENNCGNKSSLILCFETILQKVRVLDCSKHNSHFEETQFKKFISAIQQILLSSKYFSSLFIRTLPNEIANKLQSIKKLQNKIQEQDQSATERKKELSRSFFSLKDIEIETFFQICDSLCLLRDEMQGLLLILDQFMKGWKILEGQKSSTARFTCENSLNSIKEKFQDSFVEIQPQSTDQRLSLKSADVKRTVEILTAKLSLQQSIQQEGICTDRLPYDRLIAGKNLNKTQKIFIRAILNLLTLQVNQDISVNSTSFHKFKLYSQQLERFCETFSNQFLKKEIYLDLMSNICHLLTQQCEIGGLLQVSAEQSKLLQTLQLYKSMLFSVRTKVREMRQNEQFSGAAEELLLNQFNKKATLYLLIEKMLKTTEQFDSSKQMFQRLKLKEKSLEYFKCGIMCSEELISKCLSQIS